MHVLQVAWEHPPRLYGGLGRHVEGLSAALVDVGTEVTVLTPELDGPEPAWPDGLRLLRARAPATTLPPEQWVAAALDANIRMAERVMADRPAAIDVLHAHDWMAGHAARLLAPVLDVPVVATVHATERGRHQGHLPAGISAWVDAQERALVDLADHVVVCAGHMRPHVISSLGAHPDRTSVICNGVDLAVWRRSPPSPGRPAPAGGASVAARVVFAGRLEHEKGVHVLLDAAASTGWDVVVAGDGTQAPALRAHAARTTQTTRAAGDARDTTMVRFVGRLDQSALAVLLQAADVVVVPSLYEPFGFAALEAMAAGAPVVASRTGGLTEVVTGDAGLLVEPDDPAALRRAVQRVLTDQDLAGRLAAGGRRRAAALTWSAAAQAHLRLYRDLLPSLP